MKQLGMIEDKITCIAIEGCELDSKNNKEKETRYKIIEKQKKEYEENKQKEVKETIDDSEKVKVNFDK